MSDKVTYRMVAGESHRKMAEFLLSIGQPLPNPLLSCAWLAENSAGDIVAASQLQSIPLIEPFQVYLEGYDNFEILRTLYGETRKFILDSGARRILAHTGHPAMSRMLERDGAVMIPEHFWDWQRK